MSARYDFFDRVGMRISALGEWIDDRSLRRPDLGFRLVFDAD